MISEPPVPLWPDPNALGTVTDLYQLTMMAGYSALGKDRQRATFELFVRRLPEDRAYLVFAGLEQAIADLLNLAFSPEQIDTLRGWPTFSKTDPRFFDRLKDLRFTGDVWAMPEGTIAFAGEPFVRVSTTLLEAQWVETFLLASLGYPTLVASKAARVVQAAGGRPVFDFGARRGQGPHSGFLAARAAWVAGAAGTSHVEAARRLGIPCVGTMAHSWVQSFDTEAEAFAAFAEHFPDATTLLVDTYDVEQGVRHAARIEPPVQAIRIDSGDLASEAFLARALLDELGRRQVKVVGSGDLDERSIRTLVDRGAPFDAFGVGTELITSRDAPALSLVYKLVELDGKGRLKLSPGKSTYPFAKQVFRTRDAEGRFSGDRVARADESSDGDPLLVPVVREGRLVGTFPRLDEIRDHCRAQLGSLPETLRDLDDAPAYPVHISPALQLAAEKLGHRS